MREPVSPGEEMAAAFLAWAAGERAEAAARARSRERWLRQEASECSTFAGLLLSLAEQGATVSVVVDARRRRGRIVGLGRDFCVLEEVSGISVLALEAISSVTAAGVGTEPSSDREPTLDLSLAGALSALAGERAPVRLLLRGGEEVTGDLRAVGDDVLTVATEAVGGTCLIPLAAVQACLLR